MVPMKTNVSMIKSGVSKKFEKAMLVGNRCEGFQLPITGYKQYSIYYITWQPFDELK